MSNNENNKDQKPELPVGIMLLTVLLAAMFFCWLLGERDFRICLLVGVVHTLPLLIDALVCALLRKLQEREQKPLRPLQVRALALCGVVLAAGVGVSGIHVLPHITRDIPAKVERPATEKPA